MNSKCPSCKTEVEHEDYLFEVQCVKCKTRFNPFYDAMAGGGPEEEQVEQVSEPPVTEMQINELEVSELQTTPAESEAAFAELRAFGESLGEGLGKQDTTATPSPASSTPEAENEAFAEKEQVFVAEPGKATAPGGIVVTAGDTIPGRNIESWLTPLSVSVEFRANESDPLAEAFRMLARRCTERSGNAVVAVRWAFTPDGTRIVVSGTCVRVSGG